MSGRNYFFIIRSCRHIFFKSGPDHLAALLPIIFGQRWFNSSFYGFVWGSGHGLAAALMGICCFFLQHSLLSENELSTFNLIMDFIVSVTFIIIGVVGYLESHKSLSSPHIISEEETVEGKSDDFYSIDHSKLPVLVAVFLNGTMLGLSWDGLPSLAPAFGVGSLYLLALFILGYWLGTALAMSMACGIIGETTSWIGQATDPGLPFKLSFASSCLAGCLGVFWLAQTSMRYVLSGADIDYNDLEGKVSPRYALYYLLAILSPLLVGVVIVCTVLRDSRMLPSSISTSLPLSQSISVCLKYALPSNVPKSEAYTV